MSGAPGVRHPVWKICWVYFCKFGLHNMHILYRNCSEHAMFTICILFPTLTSKIFGTCICEGASKQSPDPKNSTTLEPHPWFWNSWICPCFILESYRSHSFQKCLTYIGVETRCLWGIGVGVVSPAPHPNLLNMCKK